MRDTIKGVVLGALVAAGVSVLLAQSATWTTPRNWATDDLLTAADFNAQFRDNLLWLRQDAQLTGTDALLDLGCGTLGTNEVLFSDCTWATIPDQTPANNSITLAKMADNAIGPAEMNPPSGSGHEGKVMLIGSGGAPAWQFPFEFPRTRSTRAITIPVSEQPTYNITISTSDVGDNASVDLTASASFTVSGVFGSGCTVSFHSGTRTGGATTYTTNGAKTLTAEVVNTIRGSVEMRMRVRRSTFESGCTVDSGATLILTH